MNKYILTGDMPNNCSECEFAKIHKNAKDNFQFRCINNLRQFTTHNDYWTKRHPQCPLPDATEAIEALQTSDSYRIAGKHVLDREAYKTVLKALGGNEDE